MIPSFFIPIAAIAAWNILFFSYLPVLEFDTVFSRQILLTQLYLSNLILVLAWFLCGQIAFIVIAAYFAVLTAYVMLIVREWGLGLQILIICFLYLWLRHLSKRLENEDIQIGMKKSNVEEILNLSQKNDAEKDSLIQALTNKRDRLNFMRKVSDHLKNITSLSEAGKILADDTATLIPEADQVLVYVRNESDPFLSLVAAYYKNASYVAKDKRGNEYDEWVIKRSQPLLIEDTRTDFRFLSEERTQSPFRSACIVPLMSKNSVQGTIHLSAVEPSAFQTDDLRFLDIIADLGNVVIKNILLYEKTRELSIIDGLTGCYLKRYIEERLNEEIQRSLRNQVPFGVLMIDIDHFKRCNDEFGHAAGDAVLRNFAEVIKSFTRSSDIVGRYGGEEFIAILPLKKIQAAREVAEKIREGVEAHEFKFGDKMLHITASIGVSEFPKDSTSREELIAIADERLYKAKNRGRNRVIAE